MSVLLGRVQNGARNAGGVDGVSRTVRTIVRPGASLFGSWAVGITDFSTGISQAGALRKENDRLKLMAAAASIYTDRVKFLEQEVLRLQSLNRLPSFPGKTSIPARIIGFFPGENRITISAGKDKGLKPGMPLISGIGLVGVIQTVDAKESQAMLVSSPQLRIGAIVNRHPAPAGLIRGESASKMILEIVDMTATVQPGDLVLTSGHSELIPGGIGIGRVAEKTELPEFGSVRCQVFPFAKIGDIREVAVLR